MVSCSTHVPFHGGRQPSTSSARGRAARTPLGTERHIRCRVCLQGPSSASLAGQCLEHNRDRVCSDNPENVTGGQAIVIGRDVGPAVSSRGHSASCRIALARFVHLFANQPAVEQDAHLAPSQDYKHTSKAPAELQTDSHLGISTAGAATRVGGNPPATAPATAAASTAMAPETGSVRLETNTNSDPQGQQHCAESNNAAGAEGGLSQLQQQQQEQQLVQQRLLQLLVEELQQLGQQQNLTGVRGGWDPLSGRFWVAVFRQGELIRCNTFSRQQDAEDMCWALLHSFVGQCDSMTLPEMTQEQLADFDAEHGPNFRG